MAYDPTIYVNDSTPAISAENLNKSENELEFLDNITISVSSLTPEKKTFVQGSASGNVGSQLTTVASNARCRLWKADLKCCDVVAKTGYQIWVYYTNSSGVIQSKSANWIEKETIPASNTYQVTIVAAKVSGDNISTTEAQNNILFTQPIIEKFEEVDNQLSSLDSRLLDVDGQINIDPDDFEIGAISISTSGWSRVSSTKRVSTKIEYPISLNAGDIIKLTDYTNKRFFVGYRRANNTYGTPNTWFTEDYVCQEDGAYVITMSNNPEVVLSSKNDLLQYLQILDKDSMFMKVDSMSGGLFTVPGNLSATEVYTENYTSQKAVQGLCTDGTYLYQAVMEQLGNEGAGTTIKKIRISDFTLVDSETGIFGHCNDMTYDSTNILSIYKNSENYNVITRYDPSTLEKVDDIDLSSLAASIDASATFAAIAYANDIDRYILGTQIGTDLIGFAILKPDWSMEKYIKVIPQERVLQGIEYKNNVIYVESFYHNGNYTDRRIYAYDMHGNIINYTENSFGFEIEGIAIVGDKFYLSFNQSNYQVLHLFEAIPANVNVSIAETMAKYNLNY